MKKPLTIAELRARIRDLTKITERLRAQRNEFESENSLLKARIDGMQHAMMGQAERKVKAGSLVTRG